MLLNQEFKSSETDLNQIIPINPILDMNSLTISTGVNLPHWQCHGAIYHISFRFVDSSRNQYANNGFASENI